MGSRLILGLGNPGVEYVPTRHNVGFSVVEELARRRTLEFDVEECGSLLAVGDGFVLGKPQTFMNRSGFAVQSLIEHREFAIQDILVVFDDMNLPLGRLRLRPRGGPGGHRGLESVVETVHSDQMARLRLGIGVSEVPPVGEELVQFVLGVFEDDELEQVEALILRAADACESWLDVGTEQTMNRFNG